MEELENKYVELLLKKCLSFKKAKSLFISCYKQNMNFVEKVIEYAKSMGITDICVDVEDIFERREKLLNIDLNDIEYDPYFDKSKWNEYALKNASFLMLKSSFPRILDDVDKEKLAKANLVNLNTRKILRERQTAFEIPWCIAVLPNEIWAKELFPTDDNAYEKLYKLICQMCMVDTINPIQSWDEYLEKVKLISQKLNELEVKTLKYTNSLGTDLKITMPKNAVWKSIANEGNGMMIANMPSFEIFSSPDYRCTEGIVYSSRPLIYADTRIDEFYLRFENGKAVDFNAKEGYEMLKRILEEEEQAKYLGEVALVENNSPISNTGKIFGITLFDENASCHLALGQSFPNCVKTDKKLDYTELMKLGLNHTEKSTHVDFMVGTPDLSIEAETNKGKVLIMKNGNFNI